MRLAIIVVMSMSLPAQAALEVHPSSVVLDNPEASQQLVVRSGEGGLVVDATRRVKYMSANSVIASVDDHGLVTPRAEGKTEILVASPTASTGEVRIPVEVKGLAKPTPIDFEQQIVPILTKASCNSGGCHGKAEGQNGFKLSVFGFDPASDHEALLMDGRGRRVFLPAPEQSLLLRKGSARMPHGGGRKLAEDGLRYRRILRWIAEGARPTTGMSPVTSLDIDPPARTLALKGALQIRVTAIDADGTRRCVTTEAEYDSNAKTIAECDGRGWVQASDVPGEAAILVRYMNLVAICRVTVPRPGVSFPRPAENNFIDKHVWNKLAGLGIPPSEPADDGSFLRRVHLDTIGTLPTPAAARAFLASNDPQKRTKVIDHLLARPEYADYWAMKWADILRVDKDAVTPAGAVAATRWLRKQFEQNRPYDAMVRNIVTARGDTTAEGPAAIYKALNTPEIAARSLSQLFLGVRIECAQCHHHPSDRWGQDDYAAFAGFFSGLTLKPLPSAAQAVVSRGGIDLNHPRTKKPVSARPLGGTPVKFSPSDDRREALAAWMTAPDNPYLARAIANRIWAHYFGRGLVEPIDDLRATNPATNEPLLDELAKHLKEGKFDLKAFARTILCSRVYQLSAKASPGNASDEQHFSHMAAKPMPAEVLLDAICQVTGAPEKFMGWPEGARAIQVWDNRMPSYFFGIFGRPVRASVCECERSTEPSIAQALHLMNSPEITAKVKFRNGITRRLAESKKTPSEIVDDLFLATLCRFPEDKERAAMLELFDGANRAQATEDALWALLNLKAFVYNH